jgi:hypothetical protein
VKLAFRVEICVLRLHRERGIRVFRCLRRTAEVIVPTIASNRSNRGPRGAQAVRGKELEKLGDYFAFRFEIPAISVNVEAADIMYAPTQFEVEG